MMMVTGNNVQKTSKNGGGLGADEIIGIGIGGEEDVMFRGKIVGFPSGMDDLNSVEVATSAVGPGGISKSDGVTENFSGEFAGEKEGNNPGQDGVKKKMRKQFKTLEAGAYLVYAVESEHIVQHWFLFISASIFSVIMALMIMREIAEE